MFRTVLRLRTAPVGAARRSAARGLSSSSVVVARPSLSLAGGARNNNNNNNRAAVKAQQQTPGAAWGVVGSKIVARGYASGGGLTKDDVEGRIISLLAGFDKVNDPSNIKPTAHFANDLGLDSLDTVEVVMAIEEEFSIEIPDKDADAIHSVDKAVEYILSQPDAH